jgi:lycopene beta-cyclase
VSADVDVCILGGGLAGSLVALALARQRPEVRLAVIEPGPVGGNHIWSHFASDVDPSHDWLVEPLIVHRWPAYDVTFPDLRRTLGVEYRSITSERLAAVVSDRLPPGTVITGRVASAGPAEVELTDGRTLRAGAVLDARGAGDAATLDLGWQKFLGRTLIVPAGHGVERPLVIDATVPQIDGYRFLYVLPLSRSEVFVEDTYYSDSPALDLPAIGERISCYAGARGWQVTGITRTESGVLPVVLGGDFDAYWASTGSDLPKVGVRAGLFHPTTGYSFPDAVRTATRIAAHPDLSNAALHELTWGQAKAAWRSRGFYRMLDTMLFRAAEPEDRYRVLERFYRRPAGLISRFYAGRSTRVDQLHILSGRPPVPLRRAVEALLRPSTSG